MIIHAFEPSFESTEDEPTEVSIFWIPEAEEDGEFAADVAAANDNLYLAPAA